MGKPTIKDLLNKVKLFFESQEGEIFTLLYVEKHLPQLGKWKLQEMIEKKHIPAHDFKGRTYLIKSEILDLINQKSDMEESDILNMEEPIYTELLQLKKICLLEQRVFLTIEEVALLTNLNDGVVLGLMMDGKIPYHSFEAKAYFIKSEIKEWMKSNKCYFALWAKKNLIQAIGYTDICQED